MSLISRERSRPMRPFAANHLCDRCGGVRAKIRAHKDMRVRSTSARPSGMDARGVAGLLISS